MTQKETIGGKKQMNSQLPISEEWKESEEGGEKSEKMEEQTSREPRIRVINRKQTFLCWRPKFAPALA